MYKEELVNRLSGDKGVRRLDRLGMFDNDRDMLRFVDLIMCRGLAMPRA